jgi:hypothetical protein
MSKSQNRNMWNRRRQGNMTLQKVNYQTLENLVDRERDESSVAEIRRMMIKCLTSLRRTYENNSMNPKRTCIKKIEDRETIK